MSTNTPRLLRDLDETQVIILEVDFNEIDYHGYKGTSTNAMIDNMDMTQGAFFHHFLTKDHIGFALMDKVLADMIESRWIEPIASYQYLVQGILKNFKRLIDEHYEEHTFIRDRDFCIVGFLLQACLQLCNCIPTLR